MAFADHVDEDSDRGAVARKNLEAELLTFKEEFASLGVILGARYDGSPLIISDGAQPPPDDRAKYIPSAVPGGRAPHYWIRDNESLYDWLGPWFTLLRLGSEAPEADTWIAAANETNIPLSIIALEDQGLRDLYEAPLVLIRPDQHVAWRGTDLPENPSLLLRTVVGGVDTCTPLS